MLTHVWTKIFTAIICTFSFLLSMYFNNVGYDFLSNVMIGVFSSSLLTFLLTIISYKVARKEALYSYLGYLNLYRSKFRFYKRHLGMPEISTETKENDAQALDECFRVMHTNSYLKLQHLNYAHELPQKLNESFNIVLNIQGTLNRNNGIIEDGMEENLNKAINIVEEMTEKYK